MGILKRTDNERNKSLRERDPFFGSFFDEMENLFEDFWGSNFLADVEGSSRRCSVDISENEDNFIVEAELPGIDEENLEVKLDQDILTISAHREEKNEKKDEDKNYYRKEIRKGRFERRFRLPDNIDQDEIKANLQNGMLKITLPKSEEAKTVKNIEVNQE